MEPVTREEIFARMRELGWGWTGESDEDPDGVFVKGGMVPLTAQLAMEFLLNWRPD